MSALTAKELSALRSQIEAWRANYNGELLITGSADGWLVLNALDDLVATVQSSRNASAVREFAFKKAEARITGLERALQAIMDGCVALYGYVPFLAAAKAALDEK